MQANAATTAQAMERMGHGNDNGNGNGEGAGNSLGGGVPMMLATFLKVNPPNFKGSTDPTKADNWFQAMEHALQVQHTLFYKKYFPKSMSEARKLVLMQLKQESMTMAQYTSKFEELCRFSRVCQGALESYEG
ncbi:hypothetical protein AHAS_Ahas01G0092300 [Arachis hypogaea]